MLKHSLAIAGLCAGMLACGSGDVDDSAEMVNRDAIVIGVAGASFGSPVLRIGQEALMARDEINAAGGINGVPIDVVIRESGCAGDVAVAEVQSLIDNFDIVGLVGPTCSSSSGALIDTVIPQNRLPVIGLRATSPLLSTQDTLDLYFRLRASDAVPVKILASEVVADGVERLAILHRGGNDLFNISLADGLAEAFNAFDGRRVVSQVDYPESALVEFTDEVEELFDSGDFDGVAVIGFATDTANAAVAIAKELAERGIPRSSLKGVYFNNIPNIDEGLQLSASLGFFAGAKSTSGDIISAQTAPLLEAWREDFYALYPGEETFGLAYDAVYLMALAMQDAGINGSSSSTEIRAAIAQHLRPVSGTAASPDATIIEPGEFATAVSVVASSGSIDYNGASGVIEFDQFGDVNYGDMKLEQALVDGDRVVFSCLSNIRIFSTADGLDSERLPCEP